MGVAQEGMEVQEEAAFFLTVVKVQGSSLLGHPH